MTVKARPTSSSALTRVEVDLDAIAANVRALANLIQPAALMAVVKANAYGHGAAAVAPVALESGASWLGVYAPIEGVALRASGIRSPILVFGPFTQTEAGDLVQHGLTPTVCSLQVARWLAEAAGGRQVPFHLKVDTGLERAGIAAAEAVPFLDGLRAFPCLVLQGVYTHFAAADEPDRQPTNEQLRLFRSTVDAIRAAGFEVPLVHAANSAGLIEFAESRFNMARAGIAIYGYYPSPSVSRSVCLRPALSLRTTVVRVHNVPAGKGVGYGFEHRCQVDSRIALAPIGYGDGLARSLGNGRGRVLLHGKSAPIVGRVSMDQITIDVTRIPETSPSDTVTLIGSDRTVCQTADDLAVQAGTISYDVLAGLLPRIPRIFVRDGRPVAAMDFTSGPVPLAL